MLVGLNLSFGGGGKGLTTSIAILQLSVIQTFHLNPNEWWNMHRWITTLYVFSIFRIRNKLLAARHKINMYRYRFFNSTNISLILLKRLLSVRHRKSGFFICFYLDYLIGRLRKQRHVVITDHFHYSFYYYYSLS